MIGSFFANPNSIIVPVFQIGCFTYEFESTYPAQLNGIISPEEYRQSIENINRHIPKPRSFIIAGVLSLLAILTGFIFIILGTVVTVAVQSISLPVLTYVGAAVFPLGMIAGFVSCCVINCKNSAKLIKAVDEESSKYVNRSPVSCNWKIYTWRAHVNTVHHQRVARVAYYLVITVENNSTFNSNSLLGQVSPPVYNQFLAGACPQCGRMKMNPKDQFCSSCGRSFA